MMMDLGKASEVCRITAGRVVQKYIQVNILLCARVLNKYGHTHKIYIILETTPTVLRLPYNSIRYDYFEGTYYMLAPLRKHPRNVMYSMISNRNLFVAATCNIYISVMKHSKFDNVATHPFTASHIVHITSFI